MSNRNRRREPRVRLLTDANGAEIAKVELANAPGLYATFDAGQWQRWSETYGPRLLLNNNGWGDTYVRAKVEHVAGRLVTVARELLNPGRGVVVRYVDGDRLNLRRSNLTTEAGPARGQTLREPDALLMAA